MLPWYALARTREVFYGKRARQRTGRRQQQQQQQQQHQQLKHTAGVAEAQTSSSSMRFFLAFTTRTAFSRMLVTVWHGETTRHNARYTHLAWRGTDYLVWICCGAGFAHSRSLLHAMGENTASGNELTQGTRRYCGTWFLLAPKWRE